MFLRRSFKKCLAVCLTMMLVGLFLGCATSGDKPTPPEVSFDGLQRVDDPDFDLVYKNPDADFSVYNKLMILPVKVSYDKDWKREYDKSRRTPIPKSELDRMERLVSDEFSKAFKEVLETEGGHSLVDEADEDVILLRPALVNIKVTAPDIKTGGRSKTLVAEAPEGQAILILEIYDSLTGDILARSADRQVVRDYGGWRYSPASSVVNVDMARRAFRNWANVLKERFDAIQASK